VRKAVIDVGSNSVLLSVCEQIDGHWKPVLETSAVTGLGEGVSETHLLNEPAMSRTLIAVQSAWFNAKRERADTVVAAATMAARMATNVHVFLDKGKEQGTPIRVLSAHDEAELGFYAVANDPQFGDSNTISIIDPGGHSTELVTARKQPEGSWKIEFQRSFPVGTLRLLADFFQNEVPAVSDQLGACKYIDDALGISYLPGMCGTVVTLGATGTNLVSIREQHSAWKPEIVHGSWLEYEEISKSVSWLNSMTLAKRELLAGIEPGRGKTLPGGALILERFLFAIRSNGCFVSTRGWRHALIEQSN
jgi:exopolyphosphatase/guanosine-5'-triphosphate,3'-diphosphate pyrophosphatase